MEDTFIAIAGSVKDIQGPKSHSRVFFAVCTICYCDAERRWLWSRISFMVFMFYAPPLVLHQLPKISVVSLTP